MCRINYTELRFDHIVHFTSEDSTFATARENGSGKLRIFLIFSNTAGDRVYTRNGVASSWEILGKEDGDKVTFLIDRAIRYDGIAVYKFEGSSQAVTGPINA